VARLSWLAALAPIAAVLAGWQALALSGHVTPFMLPSLTTVLERMARDAGTGELALQLGTTLYRTFAGFLIAAAGGIALGLAIARSAALRWFFDPIISVGFPMPKIAFLPIVVLWLGFHDVSKIAMVVVDAIFPVLTATIAGTAAVQKELLWSARSMGASARQAWREIVLPAALPELLTGIQVALPIALIVCIVAEMMTGGIGLGGTMMKAARFADSPGVFAAIVEIAIVGFALVKAMAWARRRLLLWHPESHAG
jgi:ABC-type nitrate/sulfonate/bicarbonate transport system permease component